MRKDNTKDKRISRMLMSSVCNIVNKPLAERKIGIRNLWNIMTSLLGPIARFCDSLQFKFFIPHL